MDIMDLIRKKKQQMQQESGRRASTVKPQSGRSRWRILPSWRRTGGVEPFWHDFGLHFIKGTTPDEQGSTLKAVYMCEDKTFGRPCEVCAAIASAIVDSTSDDVLNALNESSARKSILVNALHVDGDDPKTPVVLELRPSIFEGITDIMEVYGDITSLEEGYDIYITREGRGLNTKYSVMASPKPSRVDPSVMDNVEDLDKFVAQQNEERKTAAITEVNKVRGVLTAPAVRPGPASRAALSAPEAPFDPDDDIPASVDGRQEKEVNPKPAAVERAVAASEVAEAVEVSSGDDDLDELLAQIKV